MIAGLSDVAIRCFREVLSSDNTESHIRGYARLWKYAIELNNTSLCHTIAKEVSDANLLTSHVLQFFQALTYLYNQQTAKAIKVFQKIQSSGTFTVIDLYRELFGDIGNTGEEFTSVVGQYPTEYVEYVQQSVTA
jgi:hypothetical protein